MELRERQREATREQMIQAVHDVLAEESPATLSMPRIAQRAGVSLRTLYRYFPTKEALVDAASETFAVAPDAFDGPITVTTLPDYLRTAWTGFSASAGAIRAQHLTPAGRSLRDRRLPRSREGVRAGLAASGVELAAEDEERLIDLVVALISSSMYLELVDRLGWTDEDGAELMAWTVATIVERARRDGGIR